MPSYGLLRYARNDVDSRGVLDPRLRGDDSNLWCYTIRVIARSEATKQSI